MYLNLEININIWKLCWVGGMRENRTRRKSTTRDWLPRAPLQQRNICTSEGANLTPLFFCVTLRMRMRLDLGLRPGLLALGFASLKAGMCTHCPLYLSLPFFSSPLACQVTFFFPIYPIRSRHKPFPTLEISRIIPIMCHKSFQLKDDPKTESQIFWL